MKMIYVSICQNDDNGNLTDKAVMMDFSLPDGETFLRIEANTITQAGKATAYQTNKPQPGQPKREVKPGALLADIFLLGGVALAIDFATGKIYRPGPKVSKTDNAVKVGVN